jgi:hypothetical protein
MNSAHSASSPIRITARITRGRPAASCGFEQTELGPPVGLIRMLDRPSRSSTPPHRACRGATSGHAIATSSIAMNPAANAVASQVNRWLIHRSCCVPVTLDARNIIIVIDPIGIIMNTKGIQNQA